MSAHRACLACRARKVKCVPGPRRCVRCTNMGIDECLYDPIKKRGVGKTLRMGQACTHCRLKKKRCDAKRPCSTCVLAKCTSECAYDDEKHPQSASTRLSDSPNRDLSGGQPGSEDPTEATPSPIDGTDKPGTLQPQAPYGCSPGSIIAHRKPPDRRTSQDRSPRIIIPPVRPPTIPPEPWIPLSFLGEQNLNVQVSDIDTTDLDMRSRLWMMVRLLNFGTYFGSKKMDVLLRGDSSGAVLDRCFVFGAQSVGMMYCIGTDYSPGIVQLHARRSQLAWEALAELFKGTDYNTIVQAAVLVASSHVYMCMPQTALLYIQKACEFITAGALRFVPTCGRPPEFSEELHETLAALSQAVYWANYLFLMCGGPEPRVTANLEKEFRQDLPLTYGILFEICPLTMRTLGILLVRDAVLLLGVLPTDDVKLDFWRQSCDRILTSLEKFSRKLLGNIAMSRANGDKCGVDVLGGNCIACLAHLAILYEVVGRTSTDEEVETYKLCDSALERLGILTSELRFDEYTYLDLLIGESWRKSLPVFDIRIKSFPLEATGPLRCSRKVVEEKYSDFHTRLPGYEPPMIYALATMEDGTTEESKYPNLMSPRVRMLYGI